MLNRVYIKHNTVVFQILLGDLQSHLQEIGELMMSPAASQDKMKQFLQELHDCLFKYHARLEDQQERNRLYQKNTDIRSIKDNWKLTDVPIGNNCPPALKEKIQESAEYQIISMEESLPAKRTDIPKFMDALALPFPCQRMSYYFGNNLGNVFFIWKKSDENDKEKEISAVQYVLRNIPRFSTRAMRREFLDRYKKAGVKTAVLRDIWQYLTQDSAAPENKTIAEVDMRVSEFFLASDDPQLVLDLRENNGRVKSDKYDMFWQVLSVVIDEKQAVHERRTNDTCYLADFVSIRDLIVQVLEKAPEGTLAPSESWIRYQFFPTNPYMRAAAKYTGQFNLKYKIQQRLLRAHHVDSKYCMMQWHYLKEFCVKWKDSILLASVDDKAIIPVGEPALPISNVRRHGKSITVGGNDLMALDHDFHVAGMVPSVALFVDIPTNAEESFYTGCLNVKVKDKIFQPSSPMRHGAELLSTMIEIQPKPLLAIFSDGGPDHNCTFKSVQLASIALFAALNLDLYCAIRCAPHHSYTNPAERCMATLNLGLQGGALCRNSMSEEMEGAVKNCGTLKSLRDKAEKKANLKDSLSESMQHVIDMVTGVFNRLR